TTLADRLPAAQCIHPRLRRGHLGYTTAPRSSEGEPPDQLPEGRPTAFARECLEARMHDRVVFLHGAQLLLQADREVEVHDERLIAWEGPISTAHVHPAFLDGTTFEELIPARESFGIELLD